MAQMINKILSVRYGVSNDDIRLEWGIPTLCHHLTRCKATGLNKLIKKGFSENVIFEQRFEEGETLGYTISVSSKFLSAQSATHCTDQV